MYDLTDLIFEKYAEGKLTEDKMILLLEAYRVSIVYHQLPLSYKGVKLHYSDDNVNEKNDIPYIKNALKVLDSSKGQSMIKACISKLDEYSHQCPDYQKYMRLDNVGVRRDGNKIIFCLTYNCDGITDDFFHDACYVMYVTIDGNRITEVYGGLND